MVARPILQFGDARLRMRTEPVEPADMSWRADAVDLLESLDTVRRISGFGRALAAPQIGSRFRLIAFDCALGKFVAVNPEITWASPDRQTIWDDCFSLPGVCMGVSRHASVSFRCRTPDGDEQLFERLDASLAELVQHEVDHLDGILMMDRLIAPTAIISRELAFQVEVGAV